VKDEEAVPAPSVLIVDDTVESLRLLADLLDQQGYEVRPVTNGRQALQAVEQDPPDLILLDINMPEMDGYEVCRRLRLNERCRDLPVIFLTALAGTVDKVRAFNMGGVDYITKPFQLDEVLARVKTHIALKSARAALAQSYGRLRALETLRDDLVQMIVHDMASPLLAVRINLNNVKRRATALDELSRKSLREAASSAEELQRMINDLLDVSRLEEGKMPVKSAAWDLARMTRDVTTAFGTADHARQIGIESPEAVNLTCDGALTRRVLENLLSNAIKHTPPGGPVRITITASDGRVRFEVQDEGPGVPFADRKKIFEKFGTVESRRNERYHSTGLGLAFCKLAIEGQGGTIGVDPRAPEGSTFWFELPT
jgi:two-component system, sensor histidine kinase and response regulator